MNSLLFLSAVAFIFAHGEVIHIGSPDGPYRWKDVDRARQECLDRGFELASEEDVRDAFEEDNYDKCNCGWVSDNKVLYPIQTPRDGCGKSRDIYYCPNDPKGWGRDGWDAFCKRGMPLVTCPEKTKEGAELVDFSSETNDYANLFAGYSFTSDGIVKGWEYFSRRRGIPIYVSIWRPQGEKQFMAVADTKLTPSKADVNHHILTSAEEVEVQRGDFIGIHYPTVTHTSGDSRLPLPIADLKAGLCGGEGESETCVEEDYLYETFIIHRHHEQLFHKDNYILDLSKNEYNVRYRMPALKPIFCPKLPPTEPPPPTPEAVIVTEADIPVVEPIVEVSRCTFPFKYYHETFYACTDVNADSQFWCATTDTYDGENWKWCDESDLFIEEIPCHFPFTYNGAQYDHCITSDSAYDKPWCSVVPEYSTFGWRHCKESELTTEAPSTTASPDGRAEPQPDDVPCHFPFQYKENTYMACTDMLSDGLWCSTEPIYDGSKWRYCKESDRHFKDLKCNFPFLYNGQEWNKCITANATQPWCSLSAEYDGINWRECTEEDMSEAAEECVYPFTYNGQEYNMCIKAGSADYWCSTTPEYSQFTWRNCKDDDRIPSNMPCHFPFKTVSGDEEQVHDQCTSHGSERYWCAVEEVANDINWRYCKEGDSFPEEKPCHLPFDRNGEETTKCSTINSVKPWCSLTPTYDPNGEWRNCRQVSLTYLTDEKTELREIAEEKCQAQGLTLATRMDARAAWELGEESCGCGWLAIGSKVHMVHSPRQDCSPEQTFGYHECQDEEAIPICVNDKV